jgi:hypothetical protein
MHTDIPSRREVEALAAVRAPWCVTMVLPTTPVTPDVQAERIAFGNMARDAVARVEAAGAARGEPAALAEDLAGLRDDDDFWAHQARSLVVLASPGRMRTYRLPSRLGEHLQVADRFGLKGLVRAVTFRHTAYVLALAEGSVRLLRVTADLPAEEVAVPGMPSDAASAVGRATLADRSPMRRVQGGEGRKLRLGQYARLVDAALREVLGGRDVPLILACTAPLDAIFRSVCTYPHLADEGIGGNVEAMTPTEIDAAARPVLDRLHAAELAEVTDLLARREQEGRAALDLGDVARAATHGAVDTLLVDLDADVPGEVDEVTGAVTRAGEDGAGYGITDEVVVRTLRAGGRVLAVRADEVPGPGPAAAILRYPLAP